MNGHWRPQCPWSASQPEVIDRLRRRLAVAISASPFAGALHSALAAAPRAAPADEGAATATGRWVHAFAAYGEPKYPDGLHALRLRQPRRAEGRHAAAAQPGPAHQLRQVQSLHRHGATRRPGVVIWMVEGLAHLSAGRAADDVRAARRGDVRRARLRRRSRSACDPQARFNNGDPVTPADVKHSFDTLASKEASPTVPDACARRSSASIVVDARTVRFELQGAQRREQLFTAGTMPVFSAQVGRRASSFDEIVTEHPITSGPYVIDKVDMPRRIEFKRNPDYWAQATSRVRRGHFNFDRVVYRDVPGQRDRARGLQGRRVRPHARSTARAPGCASTQGVKWDDGRIVKRELPMPATARTCSPTASTCGGRCSRTSACARRWATPTTSRRLQPTTACSSAPTACSTTREFAAQGSPGPGELKLLEPFRAELPPRVFGPAFVAPRTDSEPRTALRRNLLKARALLEEAGWKLDADGTLRNAQGRAVRVRIHVSRARSASTDWQRNLAEARHHAEGARGRLRAVPAPPASSTTSTWSTIVEGDFTLPNAARLSTASTAASRPTSRATTTSAASRARPSTH